MEAYLSREDHIDQSAAGVLESSTREHFFGSLALLVGGDETRRSHRQLCPLRTFEQTLGPVSFLVVAILDASISKNSPDHGMP